MTAGVASPRFPDSAGIPPDGPVMTSEEPVPIPITGLPSSGMTPGTQARMSRVPSFHTTLLGVSPMTSK